MADHMQEHQFSMADAHVRAHNSKVKDLLYGGDPERVATPVKGGKRSTPVAAMAAPFAINAENGGPGMADKTSYNALNKKNRDGAGKISSQDFGSDVYAANRANNQVNQARSRQHASEGNGNFLAMGPQKQQQQQQQPQGGGQQYGGQQGGGQQFNGPIGDSANFLPKNKKDKELQGKIGASGATFDAAVYASNFADNQQSKMAVANRNRGISNLISNQ